MPKRRVGPGSGSSGEGKIDGSSANRPLSSLGDGYPWCLHPIRKWRIIKRTLLSNPVYILLTFVPAGVFAGALGWNPTAVFILNLLAIVPLATLLSSVTEDLSANAGQTVGALLNATFGNAVELIVSTVALIRGEIRIVQASMLGAILSNILLGLGCSIIAGGYGRDCHFNATAASTMSSLMAMASASLIIPAALQVAFDSNETGDSLNSILVLSRGTSIVLFTLYIMYLYFQLKTHTRLFEQNKTDFQQDKVDVQREDEKRVLSPPVAVLTLFAISIAIAVCAEYLVGTIDDIVRTLHVNKTFISLILLPSVGNAAEHITAIVAASKDKMDLAINVAIGSSIQIALLVTPSLVLLGWIIDQPMSLYFEPFDTVVFFLSLLVVSMLIQDGESNYFEGAMIVGMYIIIAISFYVYPDKMDGVHTSRAPPAVYQTI
ncbi:Calcium/proton exchanger [Wilcoxina mikolae CBS 423.85]|nr:Calcium/proton exchanger [Wilcoxina mikolae CBS 423.85]